jgi:hypothetical protein
LNGSLIGKSVWQPLQAPDGSRGWDKSMTDKEKIEVVSTMLSRARYEFLVDSRIPNERIPRDKTVLMQPVLHMVHKVENVLHFIGGSVDNIPESKKPTQSTGRKCESCGEGDDVRFVVSGDANFPLIVCITCFDILGTMRGWKRHKPLVEPSKKIVTRSVEPFTWHRYETIIGNNKFDVWGNDLIPPDAENIRATYDVRE